MTTDAFPMIERCARAQWRALPPYLRTIVEKRLEDGAIESAVLLTRGMWMARVIPLWYIDKPRLNLISVKMDDVTDG